MDESFNIKRLYLHYLNKVGLKESEMHPAQRIETERAFYAGCSSTLVIMVDVEAKRSSQEQVEGIQYMFKQTEEFWDKQS